MIDWRTMAAIAVLGLLLVGYMARNGHARYVPDLVGVCCAIWMRHPQLAIIGCSILIIVRHSRLIAGALSIGLPEWLGLILLPGGYIMSISPPDDNALLESQKAADLAAIDTSESSEIKQSVAEIHAESFYLGETVAIARLVADGALGLTEGVKIGGAAKSGAKYQKRTKAVQAEIERITNRYPQRTPEQEEQRAILNP
jgi:hypothetical protein